MRDPNPVPWYRVAAVIAALVGAIVLLRMLYGEALWGDWTCGFKQCVEVKS